MNQITPKLQHFAARLIAYETNGNKSSETKIPVACLASEKLRPHLATLLGRVGFSTLLARTIALSVASFPWLRAVHVKADGSLEGFEELGAQVDPDEFVEGCVVLLSHLLGLLVAFIGEDLTLRLVRDAWPELPLNNFGLDKGGK